ncbi:MAG: hypothetical protein RL500_1261 [Pseudomonadota bacterium]|jgi:hypothetical protein
MPSGRSSHWGSAAAVGLMARAVRAGPAELPGIQELV